VIQIEAPRRDAVRVQEIEKLAAPAADVQHVARAFEIGQVAGKPLANGVLRSAELVLEADVLVGVESGRERRWRLEAGGWRLDMGRCLAAGSCGVGS
jgi:hypothetical protein